MGSDPKTEAGPHPGPDHLKNRDRCDSCVESAEQVIARLKDPAPSEGGEGRT